MVINGNKTLSFLAISSGYGGLRPLTFVPVATFKVHIMLTKHDKVYHSQLENGQSSKVP